MRTAQKNPTKVAVEPWEVADRPWKRIHVDFAGPVNEKMFMIVVDAHSKWSEVLHMPHITTELTIESLKAILARFGFPEVLASDNGTQFTATQFTIFCAENGIRHVTSVPYHAQSNGQVEIFIDTFKRALKKSTNDRRPQKDRLREFLMTYRITPHQSTELTLSEMGIDNPEEQMREMENTSGNRADRQFKIGETVMVHDYTLGQQGQVTRFVQVGKIKGNGIRTKCVTKTQGLLTVRRKKVMRWVRYWMKHCQQEIHQTQQYCRVCFWGSSQRKWVNGFSCRHNISPMDSYPICRRIQQLDRYAPFPGVHHGSSNGHRSSLQQPWSMALVSRGCSGHDTALCERGQVTSFSMMTSTLLLAVVASTNRRLFPSICSTASAMSSVQPKRRRKSQPKSACCARFYTMTTG
ncbi:Uncharacterized protein T03_8746 [Trichinella britovi]|uniref:Integrase catalytic domain-containing protein n=1 Tax=Trichinella britovi TaxID=45882 RepID=A0A0V1CB19_TRIBR|nr:Uncharacterized protein T03_8746 [Trichinella britovi]